MSRKGIIRFLGEIAGKEISEEMAKEFQDEIDEIKELLKKDIGIENFSNLELESYEMKVSSAGQILRKDFKTKIEHKKIMGMFLTHRVPTGGTSANRNSRLAIQVNRNFIFSQGLFHYTLLEKTEALTIYETAWRTDININNADIQIEYHDGSTVTPPYSVYVHLICQK